MLPLQKVTADSEFTHREPTALYRFESASITSLLDPGPGFKLGVATFPAMLLRLVSAMAVASPGFCFWPLLVA